MAKMSDEDRERVIELRCRSVKRGVSGEERLWLMEQFRAHPEEYAALGYEVGARLEQQA